jgi:putative spermidine/putrescine transport system permease protein
MSPRAERTLLPGLGLPPMLLAAAGCALLVLPQIVVIITSIDPSPAAIFPPKGISFEWYANALTRPAFREALVLSLMIAAVTALLATAIGTMAAVLVVRHRFPGRRALVAAMQLPMLIPEVMLGLGFLILFSRTGMRATLANIMLAHVVITMPFALRVIVANLQTVSVSIEEAAQVLGAGPVTSFVRVTLPVIRTGVVSALIFSFIVSFDNFTITAVLATGRGTLPIEIYAYIRTESDPTIAAISTLLIAVSILGIVAIERILGIERLSRAEGARL